MRMLAYRAGARAHQPDAGDDDEHTPQHRVFAIMFYPLLDRLHRHMIL